MLPDRPGWKTIWLGLASTGEELGYLYVINEVRTSQTAVFDRRLTIGPADQDSDDFISTLSMGDWSGGGQIDELSGADQSRYWWGIFDNRSPHQGALPPLVYNPDSGKAAGASGTSYPLGVVNNTMYYAFGTDIAGFNESGGVWYTKESLGHAPIGKGISYNGKLFVPCGANGYKIITESGTGNPVVTAVTGAADPTTYNPDALIHTNPKPVAFAIFESDKIFALSNEGGIAWSNSGASGEWEWDFEEGTSRYPKIQSSLTPYGMKVFFNRNGTPTLFINHNGGVVNYNRKDRQFNDTSIILPSYPDMARTMEVWRPGEDLWVSMGLDVIHYTAANTTIPLTGVNRDAGLPQEYRGRIVDLQAEASALYAIVGGTNELYRSFEYDSKVGSVGTGNTNFDSPQGAAVDGSGNLFVADLNNERVVKYTSGLTYSAQAGGSGSSTGQFAANDGVYDLAVDASNNVWAVDAANHRVEKFNNALSYQSMIDGRDSILQMNAYSAKYGTAGIGTGNFTLPLDIAIDSTGKQYIADSGMNRVIVRDASDVYLATISLIGSPYGVTTDASDNIYVIHYYNSGPGWYLSKYNSSRVQQWISFIDGGAKTITGVATDGTHVYVVRSSTKRIWKILASNGTTVINPVVTNTLSPSSVDVAGGQVYFTSYGAGGANITRLDTAALNTGVTLHVGVQGSTAGLLHSPQGIAVSPANGHVFVSDNGTGTHYVSEFTSTGTFVQRFGGQGSGNGQFDGPVGLAFNAAGTTLSVADATNNRIQRFINNVTLVFGTADNKLNRPKSIAINRASGNLWINDTGNAALKVWDAATATYITKVTTPSGSGTGQFASGVGHIAASQSTSSDYLIYAIDAGNNRVNIYRNGTGWIGSMGEPGTGDGQFQLPTSVEVNEANGNVWVTDATRDVIQEFTALGQYIRTFGSTGTGNGQMTGPSGIAGNTAGQNLFLVDATQNRVTKFVDQEVFDSLSSIPHLQRWTGIGWGGVWEGTSGVTPTWMNVVNVVGAYYLTWGADDGNVYRMDLNRYIHNPRQNLQPLALGKYATTGYIETASSDMNMLGFKKIASHVMVFMRHATTTERMLVSIDPDDTGWQTLGYVTQPGKTTFPLNPSPPHGRIIVDELGNTASLGMAFNWIRMKFELERGELVSQTPIIRSVNLHFLKVPQNTTTYALDIALPKDTYLGRDGEEISDYINSLLTANEMVLLKHHNKLYRGRLANVTGVDVTGEDYSGVRMINFVEIADEGGS